MAFDIAAIQDKYGVNEDWATGNDTYVLSKDVNRAPGTYYHRRIWDARRHTTSHRPMAATQARRQYRPARRDAPI